MNDKIRNFFYLILFSLVLTACSSGSDAIDKFFGGALPSINILSSKTIAQTELFKIDVNNIKDGLPGNDDGMTYQCYFDRAVDGVVAPTKPCTTIPDSTVTFNTATGVFQWTPDQNNANLGQYEIKISGTNGSGETSQIFDVGVRLKFTGVTLIQNITGTSADLSWIPNASAVAYQIYKVNSFTGLYELHSTIAGGGNSGGTMANLLPSTAYTIRVQAIDSLGFPDGNIVTSSFITTQLVKLSMAASTTNAVAGTPVTFTINAFNSDDSPQTVGGLALSSSVISGTSSGNFSPITDNHNGSYTYTFTPTTVGTAATIDVSTTTTTYYLMNSITLNISPGPANSANSSLASTSNTVVSGSSVTLTAQIRDQYNNPISSGVTVAFNATGGTSSGNFGAINNMGNGVYTATYAGIHAGSAQSLSVSVNGTALSMTTPITVTPGLASSATSTVAVSLSTLPSGTDSTVTATLRDINGNLISNGVLVSFNKSGGTSTGNFGSVVNQGSGVYTATYTGILAGSAQTISVSVDSLLLTPTASIAVVPGAPSLANSNTSISSSTVISGSYATVTATIKDLNNNPIETGITVSFTKTGGTSTGTFGSVSNQGAGQYNIRYTGVVAGSSQNIQLQIGGINFGSPLAVTVVNSTVSTVNSTVVTSLASIVSGTTATMTATLKDSNNNPISSGVLVSFNKSGGTSTGTFGSVVNQGNGVYTSVYTGVVAGSAQTISVTVDGLLLTSTAAVTVVPGAPFLANSNTSISSSTVISGSYATVTATIKDLNNNPLDSGITVSFVKSGGTSTGTFDSVVNQGNGQYTIRYTGVGAGTAQNIQLQINGVNFSAPVTVAVVNSVASAVNSSLATTAASIVSGNTATITATIKDLNNNPISSGPVITFIKTGGTSTGTFGTTVNNGDGTYTVTYTGITAGSAQMISVLVDGSSLLNINETVTKGAADLAYSSVTISNPTVVSGSFVTATAIIKDINNNPLDSGITVSFVKSGGTSTGTFDSVVNQGNGQYTIRYTGVGAGTAQNIQLQINGVSFAAPVTVAVVNSVATVANSSLATTAASIVSGNTATITATIKDLNNNPIASGAVITFNKIGGTSTGTFGATVNNGDGTYTVTYTGVVSGSAQTISVLVDGSSLLSLTETVTTGAADLAHSSVTISSPSVVSGLFVTATATIKDVNNNPLDSGITVSFLKSGGTSTGTFGAVVNQGNGQYTIRYTGVGAGTAQNIQLQINGVSFAAPVTVAVSNGSPSAVATTVATTSTTVVSGNIVTITATLRDDNNNLISNGYTVSFAKAGGTSTGIFGSVVNNGNGTYSVTYTGVVAGSAQTISLLVDSIALGSNTVSETVTVGAPSSMLSTLTVSSNTIIAGTSSTLTATIKDANGNPISSGILVMFDKLGGTSTGALSVVTNQGNGVYTATYTGNTAGTAQTVQATVNGAPFGPTQSVQVIVGSPNLAHSSLTLSANTVKSSSSMTITAVIRDSQNNPITNQFIITVDAVAGSSTGTLSAVNNLGGGTFTATYTGVNAGSAQTIRIFADGAQISGLTDTVSVIPGPVLPANSTFTISNAASANVQSTVAAALAMNLRDANLNAISSGSTVITFSKTASVSDGTISAVTNSGGGNYSATYTGTTTGAAQTINLIVDGVTVGMSVSATVTAGPPSKIIMTAAPTGTLSSIDCVGPYTATLKDTNNNTTISTNPVTVSFSSAPALSHVGTIFTDSACTSSAATLSIPVSTPTISFYYKSYRPQSMVLTLAPNLSIASTTQNITNVPVLSWIGSSAYFTMNGSGSQTVYDDTSGGSYSPQDVLVYGNYLYVSDITMNRIVKYDISTNTMVGWIGHVGSVENISAYDGSGSCTGLSVANADLTPKWCLGGRSNMYTAATLNSPRNLATDGTYLYVASTHRILRFLLSDGSYRGWYGKMATVTGMTDNGVSGTVCSSFGAGNTTPQWCYGGTTGTGTTDGQFNTIAGFTYVSGYLYVTDYSNQRIQRLDISGTNPVYMGWIGNILSASGITPAACSSAGANAFTPVWCYGGTAQAANRYQLSTNPTEVVAPNEGFYNPRGTATDGTYLYISDSSNYRIARFNLTTATMAGWIGYIRASTALNPSTPTAATTNYTSTWTSGGIISGARNSPDGFNMINNIAVDTSVVPNILYFADTTGYRVGQVRTSDGQGQFKWIGRNSASPIGGSPGCSSSAAGAVNPGWCLGGSAGRYGNTSGAFYNPNGIAITNTKIFVADSTNARIQRFEKSTGIFDGWIGTGSVPATTWTRTLASGTIASRAGFDDYSFGEYTTNNTWYAGITSNGNHLLQTDVIFHRIKKFNALDGSVVGYVGTISGFGPVGPADCVGYTSGFTPTWCIGGGRTTSSSVVHGYNNPFSIASDSTYAYVGDYSNSRIDRVRISDGTYMGWLGYISGSPTDGESTCAGASTTTYTPGWCIGGSAGNISTNLGFNQLRSVYYDSAAAQLYVGDNSGRLIKLNPSTGAFLGVAGGASAGTGCTISGNTANSWCTTATGNSNSNYGGINNPAGIASNTNYIFVADMSSNRISRYEKATGAPAGFIGQLTNTTNLNTAATTFTVNSLVTTNGCYNQTTGYPRPTSGWCLTNTIGQAIATTTGAGDGMFNSPRGIWADDTNVYVSDFMNSRLMKYNAVTGAFIGWKGYIASLGGGMICASGTAVAGQVTPDWCTGGTSGPGKSLGAFDSPSGLTGDANYIYVMDTRNNRTMSVPR